MRPMLIAGVALALAGAFVLFRGFSFTSRESVLKIGDLEATVEEKRAVPPWLGGIALVAGTAMVAAGLRRKPGGPSGGSSS